VIETPEEVIGSLREDATVARRLGHEHDARLLEGAADRFAASLAEYLTWISEADARIRSGHLAAWFRVRFPDWERQGLARWNPKRPRERQFRAIIIPLARDGDQVRADARRAAGE
jgi:hypothetical protein